MPTAVPTGYKYYKHENLNRTGFDLYFSCCTAFQPPLIGFDAVLLKRSEPCNQGKAAKIFRIGGVVVTWNAGHNDQEAWRCIGQGGTRLLLTVSGAAQRSSGWRTPRQLARMVASARPIAAPKTPRVEWPQFRFGPAHTGASPYEKVLAPSNVSHLRLAWTFETGGAVWSSPAVVSSIVYVGSNDGRVYALRLSDGSLVWKTGLGGRPSAPAVVAGVVYVVADDGWTYAFKAATGKRLWRVPTFGGEGGFPAAPTVADGMVYVLANESLTARDARSGRIRWQMSISCFGCPVAFSHGLVYAAASVPRNNPPPAHVYALAARTGTSRWTTSLRGSSGSSPAVQYGTVYAGAYVETASGVRPWTIEAFEASTGRRLWQTAIGQSRYLTFASPAVAGGRVVFPSPAGSLVALDAHTGRSDWSVPLEFSNSAPAIANGVVYVGSNDNYLHAFDAQTGRELWRGATSDDVTSSPSVVSGAVVVGSDDGSVRAFRLDSK